MPDNKVDRLKLKFEVDYLSDKFSFQLTKQKTSQNRTLCASDSVLLWHVLVYSLKVLHRLM